MSCLSYRCQILSQERYELIRLPTLHGNHHQHACLNPTSRTAGELSILCNQVIYHQLLFSIL